jgi:Condensation domain
LSGSDGIALPLSAAQREIWFAEQQLSAGNRVYKLGEYIEIFGPVDPMLFETVLRRVVGEVDSLRVRFVEGGDGPRQIVEPSSEWLMPFLDVSEELDPCLVAQAWMRAAPGTVAVLSGYADTDPMDTDRTACLRPQHPAYVMYTSGSTGASWRG